MFAQAYELASSFTHPVVVSTRLLDGTVNCGCGAFVVLNEDGWIITAAHIFKSFFEYQKQRNEVDVYLEQVRLIQNNQQLKEKQKKKKVGRLKRDKNWILNHSFWWGYDNLEVHDVRLLPEGDLAIGRLEPFNPTLVKKYPIIKDPNLELMEGTSLCRLGFPFHDIQAEYDYANGRFILAPGTLPIPRFPIEGIFTRTAVAGKTPDGRYDIKFLETSSPGLRGQSGGPIFDVKGTIWAIQSHTIHIPLGFSPSFKRNGRIVEEHQFINVGLGIHPELIIAFLNDNSIKYTLSSY